MPGPGPTEDAGKPILVVHVEGEPSGPWIEGFETAFPDWRVVDGEAVAAGTEDDVRIAVLWQPPPGFLGRFRRLERIVSVGTGLDHLRHDPTRPAHVPVLARRDPGSTRTMAEFVLMQVLLHHRGAALSLLDRPTRSWEPQTRGPVAGRRVAILGFGPMAQASADLLAAFGCQVTAWSRGARPPGPIEVRSGWDQLEEVFRAADILVNLLPSTDDTRGLIDARRLGLLPAGAGFINVGRGDVVDQAALLQALDSGHLSLASLDVFPVEPPVADDPVWTHPRVLMTPHIASLPLPAAFARWVASEVGAAGAA